MKGIDLLSKLLSEVGDHPRGWLGSGPDIPGVPNVSQGVPLSPDFMRSIAEKFDFWGPKHSKLPKMHMFTKLVFQDPLMILFGFKCRPLTKTQVPLQ